MADGWISSLLRPEDWRIFVSSLEMLGWDFGKTIGRFESLDGTVADAENQTFHPDFPQGLGGQTSHMSFGPDTKAYAFSGYQRVPRGELL